MKTIQELSIRRTAVIVNIPEELVEIVIGHKNKAMYEALYLHRTVEDSGLGKFVIRPKKVLRKLKKIDSKIQWCTRKLAEEGLTDKQIDKFSRDRQVLLDEKEYLESKI